MRAGCRSRGCLCARFVRHVENTENTKQKKKERNKKKTVMCNVIRVWCVVVALYRMQHTKLHIHALRTHCELHVAQRNVLYVPFFMSEKHLVCTAVAVESAAAYISPQKKIEKKNENENIFMLESCGRFG